jgi:hypothetical protein
MPERPEVELDAIEGWRANQTSVPRIGAPDIASTFSTMDAALLASVERLRAIGENFADRSTEPCLHALARPKRSATAANAFAA